MPLADKIRPTKLCEVVGQEHLLKQDSVFSRTVQSGNIPNMVFFGPSGVGKTTVAEIIAKSTGKTMRKLNATNAVLSDIKDVIKSTDTLFGNDGILLYVDEIQYFNKKQQQSLLEFIEDGRITLICSTTENPYFAIYPAILSRCSVFEFKPVSKEETIKALRRAYTVLKEQAPYENADGSQNEEVFSFIAGASSGDVRKAIGTLELCYNGTYGSLTLDAAKESMGDFSLRLDKDGNEHYDLLSALQKSVRGSDENAALFYLARLLEAGDIISPSRRLLVMASEDISLAYPMAAVIVRSLVETAYRLGLPEARIPLAEATVLLATAPKSNSAYAAYALAAKDVRDGLGQKMPYYLRDSMQPEAGGNADYVYPHDFPNHYYPQQYLPDDIKDRKYYTYGENRQENACREYWEKIKKETVKPKNEK